MATLTVINNPFNRNDKTVSKIKYGKPIYKYLDNQNETIEFVVSLNGIITEDYKYILQKCDSLAVVPIPKGGGGGGKNPLKLVAMMALAIAAPQAGLAMVNAIGATTALTYAGAMGIIYGTQIAVMVGGGMLINSLLPVASTSSSVSSNSSLEKVSPTYSFSGGSNAREAGTTLPIMLGKARITPPVIGSYLSYDGDKQYLNILMAVNDGAVDDISDIEINNQALKNFENCTYEKRLGSNTQEVISGFRDSVTTSSVGVTLNETTVTTFTTKGNIIDELEIVISLAQGYYYVKDDGNYIVPSTKLSYKIEYKKTSENTWKTHTTKTLTTVYKTTKRLSTTISKLEKDKYDIRVTRLSPYSEDTRTANSLQLEYVNEIVYDDFTYPGTSLLAVKAMATDQLNGNFPTVTAIVQNTNTISENKAKTNPAWACYDLLKREGIPDDDINLEKFQEWADYCDKEDFTCNLYIDSKQELQAALNMVSILGRATVVQMGSVFNPIISKVVEIPTQSFLFTSANIEDGSFKLDYIPYNDRSNVVEVTYYDEEDNYASKTVQVQSNDFDATTVEIKSSITLFGCTKRSVALRYAQFLINQNRYLSETVSFTADIDAIACSIGDVIKVGVKYMTNTLASGRLLEVTGKTIVLDQEIQLESSKFYQIQLRLEDDTLYSYNFVSAFDEAVEKIDLDKELTVSNPKNIVFAFGLVDTEATNNYQVNSITRENDFKRRIVALEYNKTVFDDNVNIEVEEVKKNDFVTNLKAESFLIRNQDSYDVGLNISWNGNRLSYPIYYKLSTETTYKFYTNSSTTNKIIKDLVYGETYDIKVYDKVITVTFEDTTIPPKVSSFTINGAAKEMKTLNFSLKDKPIDFKGYDIRYQLGNYTHWDSAIRLSDNLITQSPYQTELLGTKGTYTIMIKAVDIFGNESAETSNILFEQSLSLYQNLVFTMDFKKNDWDGKLNNLLIKDENLEAIEKNDDDTYTASFIGVFYPDVGETAKVSFEGDGSPLIYYRTFGDELFYSEDNAYTPDNEYIFREETQKEWQLYKAGFKAKRNTPYQVKIEFTNSVIKPIIREFKVEVDARDVLETFDDIKISKEGLRIYASDIDSVKWVGGALQDDGGTAKTVNYIKYPDGAFIKVYDVNGAATSGLVDILMKGYNNG